MTLIAARMIVHQFECGIEDNTSPGLFIELVSQAVVDRPVEGIWILGAYQLIER
jgi:hypothetical protein